METTNYKISKAQIEVWEWKESIHQQIKDMSLEDGLKYIAEKAKKTKELLVNQKFIKQV